MGVDVEAPNDALIVSQDGKYKVEYDGSGKMITFKPKGSDIYEISDKCLHNKKEGDKMKIKQYDRVLMQDGSKASIVEIFEDEKSFIADIERNGDIDTEEISIADIKKVL